MPGRLGLQGEFYQYVLAAVYHADGLWADATFDLYARALPTGWGYFVAAGLGPVLDHLEALRFSDAEIDAIRRDPVFAKIKPSFFDFLKRFKFTGEIKAVPEGSVVFPSEPILRVTAPLVACTLIETRLIQLIASSTAVATRAARMVDVAGKRPILDFGSRRCPSPEAALLAARSAYIGGVAATTNALAAFELGIPSMGTMADTFLAAYGNDRLAYDAFRLHFPGLAHLSLPDDDPGDGVEQFARFKNEVASVRIDHDDLGRMSHTVRDALDRNGMKKVRILGSGHLDEHRIAKLVASKAPVNLFAVGRALAANGDLGMSMAFRIAEMTRGGAAAPVTRQGSSPYPGKKQIIRFSDRDLMCLDSEQTQHEHSGGRAILRVAMRAGVRMDDDPNLADVRQRRADDVKALPASVRKLDSPASWPVGVSDALAALSLG